MRHRGMHTEFEWQKIKADKKMTRLFSIEFIVLDFSTPCFFFLFCFFFSQLFTRLKRSSSFRGKMIQKWSEGKKKLLRVSRRFELAGGSSYLFRRRHIPGINIALLITYCQESSCYFGHRTQMNLMSFS